MTKPPEGSPEELIWLRGFESGVDQMRTEKPVNMLACLYQEHMHAHKAKNEPLRQRYYDLITEFEWAFPEASKEFHRRYIGGEFRHEP